MFIYSVKASTLRFVGAVFLSVMVVITLLVFLQPIDTVTAMSEKNQTVNYADIRTNEDRIAFLSQFGWETTGEVIEETTFVIPAEFDRVLAGYNEVQKLQGLDLSRYEKKTVSRYTYKVTNYGDYEGTVYANLIVYKNKVVAGDICSAEPEGFVHGFEKQ